jgi:hypothetical protein
MKLSRRRWVERVARMWRREIQDLIKERFLDRTSYFAMLYYHVGSLNASQVRAYAMLVIMEQGSIEWYKVFLSLVQMYQQLCRNMKCGCTHTRTVRVDFV